MCRDVMCPTCASMKIAELTSERNPQHRSAAEMCGANARKAGIVLLLMPHPAMMGERGSEH